MKVGTDGVLLGAWTRVPGPGGRVLDVGTGTGLIALMIAQRTENVRIDAVEIDQNACNQTIENFSMSEWKDRLNVTHSSYQAYMKGVKNHYDLVICNPPFFSDSLKAPDKSRSIARHDDLLNPRELFLHSSTGMKEDGSLSIIIPYSRMEEFIHIAEGYSFYCNRLAKVKPVPEKPPKRVIIEFSGLKQTRREEEFIIEESGRHGYSERFMELTKDFYL